MTSDSGLATLEYQIYHARAPGNDQVGEGAVAVAFNIMRDLCGADWKPVEVHFAHRKPADIKPYRRYFQAGMRFDAEQYAVVFNASWLSRRLSDTNPESLRLLQQEINKLEVQQGDNFLDQVRSLLRATIVTGHSSADQVAALFSMNRRTLNRHLKRPVSSLPSRRLMCISIGI